MDADSRLANGGGRPETQTSAVCFSSMCLRSNNTAKPLPGFAFDEMK
jgi:hypothetical protein